MKYADLHTHTYFSDGTLSPVDLIQACRRARLAAVSIVDHDTLEGLAQAEEEAGAAHIELIPGIELSAEFDQREIHVLGYFIDRHNEALARQLLVLKKNRIERIYKIIEKLEALGVRLSAETVFAVAGGAGTVGRMHVARALVRDKHVKSVTEAFAKYIGDKGPAYVLGFRFSPRESIDLIKQAGGIPVIAHPYLIRNDEVIPELVKHGLMGVEVYYPEHSQSQMNYYRGLAEEYNLLITGGSDYHGTAKPGVKLNCMKLSYEYVRKLKEARPTS